MSNSTAFRRSWLVQRLEAPTQRDNPFSFGGGLRNGGLSAEAMQLLRSVWSFDYMGAAEYEFGAVPQALETLAKSKTLIAFALHDVEGQPPPKWMLPRGEKPSKLVQSGTVYVLCPSEMRQHVEALVRAEASEVCGTGKIRDGSNLWSALFAPASTRVRGWLELDNGFLFFTDREMFERACRVFGVEVAQ